MSLFKELSRPCPLCNKGTLRPTEGLVGPDGHVIIKRKCDNCGHPRPKIILDEGPDVRPMGV
jgi:endogenous inhibitor of DNA gyrase (YacG/DUF329 family)